MNIKNLIISAVAFLLSATAAFAVPARPGLLPYRQPDGSTILVKIAGDENSAVYRDENDRVLAIESDGTLRLATPAESDAMLRQHETALRRSPARRAAGAHSGQIKRTGMVPACVILVQFSDAKFSVADPRQYFSRWLNEPGFSADGMAGSVRDYFISNSAEQFQPTFDVYGPVTLSGTRQSYSTTGSTAYKMATQGATAIDSEVDFSKYDLDNDGYVDNIFVIFAGVGANQGGTNSPWSHGSDAPTGLFTRTRVDGKTIKHYACTGELNSAANGPDGIGTFVHEFSHILGLADHYASTQNSLTPNWWDVMDTGCYSDNGRCPCNMNAFERSALEWAEPTTLTEPSSVRLRSFDATGFACKIETGRSGDYYLLENRTASGFDTHLVSTGMLIWHIDVSDNSKFAFASFPNDNNAHMCVDLVEADGSSGFGTWADMYGDPWPGSQNQTEFTGTSSPAMIRWNNSSGSATTPVTDKPVTNIARNVAGVVTFDFMGGSTTNIVDPQPPKTFHFAVAASPADGGTVSIGATDPRTEADIEEGTQVILYATAADGYEFVDWRRDGQTVATVEQLCLTANSTNAGTYTANFAEQTKGLTVSVRPNSPSWGSAWIGDDRSSTSVTIPEGENDRSLTLHAEAAAGYEFDRWTTSDGWTRGNTPDLRLSPVTADNAGEYIAVFRIDEATMNSPGGTYTSTYWLTSISSSSAEEFPMSHIRYTASGPTGSFHNRLPASEGTMVTAHPGDEFILNMKANDDGVNYYNMRYAKVYIYNNFAPTDSAPFAEEAVYGNNLSDNGAIVMDLDHPTAIPADATPGDYLIRAIYVSSYFWHISGMEYNTKEINRGVSYDIPVRVVKKETTAAAVIPADTPVVTADGTCITVTAPAGTAVTVISPTGAIVARLTVSGLPESFDIPSPGLYIVTIGDYPATKLLCR
ncbi:MAG: M6 family metalloprotease domain-containing protein [Clostridium sp.]|nr:M6 family metalloprotease domain-containing protein [Clostridium sp.]